MSTILEKILEHKRPELEARMKAVPLSELKRRAGEAPEPRSFAEAIRGKLGLIAEIKRRSPSMADMRAANFEDAPSAYRDSVAVQAVSVLTDEHFFGMGLDWLPKVRNETNKPVLRKDFIWEDYQVVEARAYHADAILLMVSVVKSTKRLHDLNQLAEDLGMATLFEVHSVEEIERLPENAWIIGVNSRNFRSSVDAYRQSQAEAQKHSGTGAGEVKDLSVSLDNFNLVESLPNRPELIKVAESGVHPSNVSLVRRLGFHAILVGTSLLKEPKGIRAGLEAFEKALMGEGN